MPTPSDMPQQGPVSLRSADVQRAPAPTTTGGPARRRPVISRWIARPNTTEKRN